MLFNYVLSGKGRASDQYVESDVFPSPNLEVMHVVRSFDELVCGRFIYREFRYFKWRILRFSHSL